MLRGTEVEFLWPWGVLQSVLQERQQQFRSGTFTKTKKGRHLMCSCNFRGSYCGARRHYLGSFEAPHFSTLLWFIHLLGSPKRKATNCSLLDTRLYSKWMSMNLAQKAALAPLTSMVFIQPELIGIEVWLELVKSQLFLEEQDFGRCKYVNWFLPMYTFISKICWKSYARHKFVPLTPFDLHKFHRQNPHHTSRGPTPSTLSPVSCSIARTCK